jgi:hypothetical protein
VTTDNATVSLRVEIPSHDGNQIVEIKGPLTLENGLHTLGDWALAALEQHADGADKAARPMLPRSGSGTGRATSNWLISSTHCLTAA